MPWTATTLYAPESYALPRRRDPAPQAAPARTSTLELLHHEDAEERLLCYCFGIPEAQVRRTALADELKSVVAVTKRTRAGVGCGSCHPDIEDLLTDLWREADLKGYVVLCHELGVTPGGEGETEVGLPSTLAGMSPFELTRRVTEALNTYVRPFVQSDGGDIQLIDIQGSRVMVSLVGSCESCSASLLTLKGLVQERLRQHVSPDLEVVPV